MSPEPGLDRLGPIATRRLLLAALEPVDAEDLRALTDDRVITDAVHFLSSPFTLADAKAVIGSQVDGRDRYLGMRLLDGGTLVGVIGAHLDGNSVEVGYWVGVCYHGRGYATEAAKGVVATLTRLFPDARIFAECRPENTNSWRVLSKVGFVPTGEDGIRAGRKLLVLRPISST